MVYEENDLVNLIIKNIYNVLKIKEESEFFNNII